MIPEAAARPSRRSVVAAAVAAVGTGCSADTDGRNGGGAPGSSAAPPGTAEQARAVRDSTELIGRYDAAAAAHPSLASRLTPLRAEVAQHVEAFGGTPPAAGAKAAATGAGTTPAQALTALAAAERRLADSRAAALLTVPGGLARLLASVAAAGAAHAALLSGEPGSGGRGTGGGDGTTGDDGHEG
ncbi:hypothetical protein [Streptomyces sp. NPDC020983]|uniref:hypothetical protein n=1 Tax=Streptomyces sp. NPDC020983 TaxID=3365106 RepID=UPI00378C17C4